MVPATFFSRRFFFHYDPFIEQNNSDFRSMNYNTFLIIEAVRDLRSRILQIRSITDTLVDLNADMFSALFIRDFAALRYASGFEAILDVELDYYVG
jgi:hypothetical protein